MPPADHAAHESQLRTPHTMQTRTYTVRFLSPAFLGNASQAGQWRTPPFKALLRQWWRVAVASSLNFNTETMRAREAKLFGVAADGGSNKSLLRLRLNRWDEGRLRTWSSGKSSKVSHPEVRSPVDAQLYLGYGPLIFNRNSGTTLKKNAAIQSNEDAVLKLAFPSSEASEIDAALWLADRFGAIGGRSRNGWGSLSLVPAEPVYPPEPARVFRDWRQALQFDWPHAIGTSNDDPLIWETEPMADWESVMKRLAEIKVRLRTQFKFTGGNGAPRPEQRHWLSYPVTNHSVKDWGSARLPNSLRFKLREDAAGKLRGVVFHMPCMPPPKFRPSRGALEDIWGEVHGFLDAPAQKLHRIAS